MRLLQKEHLLIFQSTLPDPRSRAPVTAIARFQSTLPERGETLLPFSPARRGEVFQSTLPAWGETPPRTACRPLPPYFNPLSPHGERHFAFHAVHHAGHISIHSPRMGRDQRVHRGRGQARNFNPLSPHGERLDLVFLDAEGLQISIHSPRMGRDGITWGWEFIRENFNPLSPHGERLRGGSHPAPEKDFNPLSTHGERPNRLNL